MSTCPTFFELVLDELFLCRVETSGDQEVSHIRCAQLREEEGKPDRRGSSVFENSYS